MFFKIKQKTYKLLRLSEKCTHTDMVYLAKGGFWITSNKIVGTVVSICLAIAYAHFLSKEDYGLYKYIISIASFFSIATLPGLNNALTRGVALGYEGVIKKAVKLKFKFGLLGILGGLAISAYYFFNHNQILGLSFLIAAIIAPLNDSLFVYGSYLGGKKLFKYSAIANSISQILTALIIIITIAFSSKIIYLISVYYISAFILHFVINYLTYKKYPPNKIENNETISLGKHLSVMDIFGIIAEQIDKILMWHFLGPAQLAIYSYATLPIESFQSFVVRSISPLALPKLSTQKKETLKITLPLKIFKFSAALILPSIIYFFISPFLFKILFPEYIESIKYTQIYGFALLLFPARLFGTSLLAHAQKKSLYIIKIIQPLFKIITMVLFIYFWGINGAILSLLISGIFGYFINYYFFKKIN